MTPPVRNNSSEVGMSSLSEDTGMVSRDGGQPYFACSTPAGSGGISVIRVAGDGAAALVDKMFAIVRSGDGADSVEKMGGYTAAFGRLCDPVTAAVIDDVVCTRFRAPHSYTGEDCVEVSCHGGHTVRQEILRLLAANGGRVAEPGEFTKRAFLNGKMDLSQAEAVMDVISAQSELALSAAQQQLAGGVCKEVRRLSALLYELFASLELIVEFPEHEDGGAENPILVGLRGCLVELDRLSVSFARGRILHDGMSLVLAGVPNSGKSSLLNRLAGYDRAIVTSRAGTTRDTLEVVVSLGGIPVRVIDTAGIRDAQDEVERIGVDRAKDAVRESDILLWLLDEDGADLLPDSSFAQLLAERAGKKPMGLILSKSDVLSEEKRTALLAALSDFLEQRAVADKVFVIPFFSSKTGEGLEILEEQVLRAYEKYGRDSEVLLTNARHAQSVNKALGYVRETVEIMECGYAPDMACALLRAAMDALGEITGDTVSEELVNQIFSRFCIGK